MVETIRLESGHTLTGIVGSNPTLSAISFVLNKLDTGDTVSDTEIRCPTEQASQYNEKSED